jgi:hypothetical protein
MYKKEKVDPLFCFIFKITLNEDIHVKQFCDFFNGTCFLSLKFDQISWRPSLQAKELRSVEISWLFYGSKDISFMF